MTVKRDIGYEKSTEWFDVGVASAAFMEYCGPSVILVSIEVSVPERREVCACFEVRGIQKIFGIAALCGGGRSYLGRAAGDMGRAASGIAREAMK